MLFFLFLFSSFCSSGTTKGSLSFTPLTLQFVVNATERNAICNDGSPSGYYIRRANSSSWILWFEGGAYCYDEVTCKSRCESSPNLCSSNSWPQTQYLNGIMSDNPLDNIDFYEFNQVFIPYCSSDLWSGSSIITPSTFNFTFHGFEIINSVVDDLLNIYNMDQASSFLYGGGSAGGIASLIWTNYLYNKLSIYPSIVDIRGLCDAGWFVPVYPVNGSNILPLETQVTLGIPLWNTSFNLLGNCFNEQNSSNEYWKCFMGEVIYPTFKADVFIYMSQTDGYILAANGFSLPPTQQELPWLYNLMNLTAESLQTVKNVFSPNGYIHTAMRSDHFNCMSMKYNTLQQSVGNWYFYGKTIHLIDACKEPNCDATTQYHWPCTNIQNSGVWRLTFAKQYGFYMEGHIGSQSEIFTFYLNGTGAVNTGITNIYNNDTAIFGYTQQYGDMRIAFDTSVKTYDFHVYDPQNISATDYTPVLYWENNQLPNHGFYRWEFHWTLLDENYYVTPWDFVYNYDLINYTNTDTNEPSGYYSDQFKLTNWSNYQAQTFIVPNNIYYITQAKAFCVRGSNDPTFTMIATIRADNPEGVIVGVSSQSRQVYSNEFENVVMTWNLGDVLVVPGRKYALRLDSLNGQGFNVYGTINDTYKNGSLYNGPGIVENQDMIGIVVGNGHNYQ